MKKHYFDAVMLTNIKTNKTEEAKDAIMKKFGRDMIDRGLHIKVYKGVEKTSEDGCVSWKPDHEYKIVVRLWMKAPWHWAHELVGNLFMTTMGWKLQRYFREA